MITDYIKTCDSIYVCFNVAILMMMVDIFLWELLE